MKHLFAFVTICAVICNKVRGENFLKSDIGNKIKSLRKQKKVTQQELADKIGLNRATISNYEVGRRTPHLPELQLFADYFGVGLDYFGVATRDEVFDALSRAKDVFENESIPRSEKEKLYKELMRLYLSLENDD